MKPTAFLLHDIFPSGDAVLALLMMVLAAGVLFAFVGVWICRKYGLASLALSTVAFCLLVLVASTSVSRDLGEAAFFPIAGGFLQAAVIGYRTRDGRGGPMLLEALLGGAMFIVGLIGAGIMAAVIANV